MKCILVVSFIVFTIYNCQSQIHRDVISKSKKGSLYFYWGWNIEGYSKSNIHFSGEAYDFTLNKVIANDRQSKFSIDTYFHPKKITIPQYNYRIGYFIKENWDISLGMDHMKYVVQQNQEVIISGEINNHQSSYDGVYSNDKISLAEDFLLFEHTDGLNYLNAELRHSHQIFGIRNIHIRLIEGAGFGAVVPRTNTTLLGKERYDEFHLSGYGLSAVFGVNITFFDAFFIQSELKGGYIDLPAIRTTISKTDHADQHFFFGQFNIVFGGIIQLHKKRSL